jgi:hypothetical protein
MKAKMEAKKAASAAKPNCAEKLVDKNGRCPGESGYVSFTKEDPGDWAVSI